MNQIEALKDKLKKKMELQDYVPEIVEEKEALKEPKTKVTFYAPESVLKLFNKIYAENILDGQKIDKSTLFCEMVKFYYDRKHS